LKTENSQRFVDKEASISMRFLVPENESERLRILRSYDIVDTPAELSFDALTRVAMHALNTPAAVIGLMDADRLWFKSQIGLGVAQLDRQIAFCAHAIMRPDELLVVEDLQQDARFRDNPLVTQEPYLRFYAGAALVDCHGYALGTIAVVDTQPRKFSEVQRTLLRDLSALVITALENRTAASELERVNAKLEEDRTRLAERVLERTAQLQYANHAKDSFLATMSHEIRTPLGGLLGMMELLSLSRLDQEQNEILAAAQKSGKSLLRIVNDILDWSKIEAGKLELAPRVASLSEMFKSVASTYFQIAFEKDIQLKFEIDPQLGTAHLFDPLRISQILNNFTSNALKFTELGSVTLGAHRLARHDGSETIRFSVQDSGVGIEPEQQQRLFQQYEQASAETARMYGGTGLGLAICQRLAGLMGGQLGVESIAGIGSTFSFTVDLPVANQVAQAHLRQLAEQNGSGEMVSDTSPLDTTGQGIGILIVDDHPLNRMLLKQQLGMLGVQVEAAADGAGALSLWQDKDRHFDLIITDCHMPVMDGYELTYRIRDRERQAGTKRIPIIAWTANVLVDEAEHCHAAGMDDLLTKPTELADLRAMLLKWLVKTGVLPT
jgi:signal transduction histidine kinase/ActR/RegA family two-component response regulator